MRNIKIIIVLLTICSIAAAAHALPEGTAVPEKSPVSRDMPVNELLDAVESHYKKMPAFSADFTQESTLKAMDITDTAEGHAIFKRPGKMRWVYQKPEPQQIITDGARIWIYRPTDNQVTVGAFPTFFGDGKGASFLSDMRMLRQKFHIIPLEKTDQGDFTLELRPISENPDINRIRLTVDRDTFLVEQIITTNAYGDETRIRLGNIRPEPEAADEQFVFKIPKNTDVIHIDE